MQKKLTLLLTLMTLSVNTYAIQLTNGKLISEHSITGTGNNLKVTYQDLNLNLPLKSLNTRVSLPNTSGK